VTENTGKALLTILSHLEEITFSQGASRQIGRTIDIYVALTDLTILILLKSKKPEYTEKTRKLFSIPKPKPIPTEKRHLRKKPNPIPTKDKKSSPQSYSSLKHFKTNPIGCFERFLSI
jgi:hypothetical protein